MYVFPETGDRKYQKSNDKIVIIMKGILETVASVVERLSLSSAEKKRLKQELETALLENECQRVEMQARVVGEEARGNWLQRSWRPVLMLAFAVVILAVYRLAGVGRYLPVLGFAGNRVGRIYRRTFPDEKVSEEQFIKFIKL